MKINITKKEYRLLIDMLSISEWVINSYRIGKDPKTEPYEKLGQKFLSCAKDFGFDNLIAYEKSLKGYYPTEEYEDLASDRVFIDEFEEEVFWDELCTRLAQRDLLEEKGVEKIKAMDRFERLTEETKIAEKYNDEFVANGIKNLRISNK